MLIQCACTQAIIECYLAMFTISKGFYCTALCECNSLLPILSVCIVMKCYKDETKAPIQSFSEASF